MVVSEGDDGIDISEGFRLRIEAAEATEDLLRKKEVSRGKSGSFGVEGVVGVLIGDCCRSGISNGAFISDRDEFSGKCGRLEIREVINRNVCKMVFWEQDFRKWEISRCHY